LSFKGATMKAKIWQAYGQGQAAWQQVFDGLVWETDIAIPYSAKTEKLLFAAWRKGYEEAAHLCGCKDPYLP
jgi:hypothetical protein